MLRLLQIFLVKNWSRFFSKLVRVKSPNNYIFLIGTIKLCNTCCQHFLLRSDHFLAKYSTIRFTRQKRAKQTRLYCTFRFGEWLVYKPDGGAICEDKVYCKRFDNWHWWPSHQRCYRQFSQGPCRKGSILHIRELGIFTLKFKVLVFSQIFWKKRYVFITELSHFGHKDGIFKVTSGRNLLSKKEIESRWVVQRAFK